MANITKKNNEVNAQAMNKEEKNMAKVNEIVNAVVNITAAPKANKVTLVKKAGTTYLKLNNFVAGAIGGSQKDQDANVKCIQFMVNNCDENADGKVLAEQCMALTCVMADLEKVSLDDIVRIDKVDYAIDTNRKEVYAENGQCVVKLEDIYPELNTVEIPAEGLRAILIGELNKNKIAPVANHKEDTVTEDEMNIESEQKLGVFDTIKGLRALGMVSSWFNANGVKQMFPICYNGDADLKAFAKVVKDALDNDKDYLDIIMTSCKMRENELNLDDETLVINDVNCVIDYTQKEIWDENINNKLASMEDIEYKLPKEAIKVMLIERAKTEIERLEAEEAEALVEDMYCDCDGDCKYCAYADDCEEANW